MGVNTEVMKCNTLNCTTGVAAVRGVLLGGVWLLCRCGCGVRCGSINKLQSQDLKKQTIPVDKLHLLENAPICFISYCGLVVCKL